MAKSVFYFEHTDLFGGECNYCFINRFAVMASTERGAVNVLSRHIGLSHRFDGSKYVSRSGATAFYTVDSDNATDAFKPVNFGAYSMTRYSVIVGNIGTIGHYPTKKAALRDFAEYKRQSKAGYGKVAFESVTLFDNDIGEPIREYIGTIDNNEEE